MLNARCRMLHNDPVDMSEHIRWDKSGRLLLIPNEADLVEKVCKVHFSQKSITSFVSLLVSLSLVLYQGD